MSDEKLRELERRWRESGSVEDEAAYLRERVRVGDLSNAALKVALLLEHPPIAALFPSRLADQRLNLVRLERGIRDKDALVRSYLAAVRLVLPFWEREYVEDVHRRRVVEAVEDWGVDASFGRQKSRELIRRAALFLDATRFEGEGPRFRERLAAWNAGEAVRALARAVITPGKDMSHLFRSVTASAKQIHRHSQKLVLNTIRDELVPWAPEVVNPVETPSSENY